MTITTKSDVRKSTTVRTPIEVPGPLRAAFGVLDRVAPGVAGRWAARLWCTLPAGRGRRRDDRPALPGDRRMLTTRRGWRLAVEAWGPAAAAPVYLVHGWGGWRGQLGALVEPLVAAGHRVVAFDTPSHGESDPGDLGARRSTGAEFADALVPVVAAYGPPAAVVGHSLGAAGVALVARDGLVVPRLVLVAPAAYPLGGLSDLRAALGFGERTERAFTRRLERLARRPLDDFVVPDLADRWMPPRTLVIHDTDDREVSVREGRALVAAWPGARLVETSGLGHQRILRDPSVIAQAVSFVGR
ncbi:MAG: alpha/beta fold hydrolase [Streptosporangiales bacterium]|nr:alpha/beta fold hydrolase [Streptosporangiales bacterium]